MNDDCFCLVRPILLGIALAANGLAAADTPEPLQTPDRSEVERLQQMLVDLKAEQTSLSERIAFFETALGELTGNRAHDTSRPNDRIKRPAHSHQQQLSSNFHSERLDIFGDIRLRYEGNTGTQASDRHRGVLRARVRGRYDLNSNTTLGAGLTTGDPDDPNSAGATLDNFADTLELSIDQLYLRGQFAGATLWGGRFPQIFSRTSLVWDKDLSLPGVGMQSSLALSDHSELGVNAAFVLIDEDAEGSDSSMYGGQLVLNHALSLDLSVNLSLAYFDYDLDSELGANQSDYRENRRGDDGRYLSDFNLLDGILRFNYLGLGDGWPFNLGFETVRNLGAETPEDLGYSLFMQLGTADEHNPLRIGYS